MKPEDMWGAIVAAVVGGLLVGYCVRLWLEQRKHYGPPRAHEREVDDMLADLRAYQEALVQVAWCEMRIAQRLRNRPPGQEWDNAILRAVEVGQRFAFSARAELEDRGLVARGTFTKAPSSPQDASAPAERPNVLELVPEPEEDPFRARKGPVSRWESRANRKH